MRVLEEIRVADPTHFAGRLNILRGLQVMGEIFKGFSPIVMQSIDTETLRIIKRVRNVFAHFNKRRFELIRDDTQADVFAKVKAEVLAFIPRFSEIEERRKAIAAQAADIIWEALKRPTVPAEAPPKEWFNLNKLVKSWDKASSTTSPTEAEHVRDLIDILEAMRGLIDLQTDCILEAEKTAWAEIAGGKFGLMQQVYTSILEQDADLRPEHLEAFRSLLSDEDYAALSETILVLQTSPAEEARLHALKQRRKMLLSKAESKLNKLLYDQAAPERLTGTLIIANEFINATSRIEMDAAHATLNTIQGNFIFCMEAYRPALEILGVDIAKAAYNLRERTRAQRSLAIYKQHLHQILVEKDTWSIQPPKFLIDYLTADAQAGVRSSLEALMPIICRQAIDTLGMQIPVISTLEFLGNFYAHPHPARREMPNLDETITYDPPLHLGLNAGFIMMNLYYILQEYQAHLMRSSAGAVAGIAMEE